MKSFVTFLLLSLFCACRALDCHSCLYVEDKCGKDCKKEGSVTYGLQNSNYQSIAEVTCYADRALEAKSALNISNVSRSGSGTQLTTHYPYCLKAATKLNGKDITIRTYGWFPSTDLDGKTEKNYRFTLNFQTFYADLHFCNGNKCNGSTSLKAGVPAITAFVMAILAKFVQL